jgi:hypothetical protein
VDICGVNSYGSHVTRASEQYERSNRGGTGISWTSLGALVLDEAIYAASGMITCKELLDAWTDETEVHHDLCQLLDRRK